MHPIVRLTGLCLLFVLFTEPATAQTAIGLFGSTRDRGREAEPTPRQTQGDTLNFLPDGSGDQPDPEPDTKSPATPSWFISIDPLGEDSNVLDSFSPSKLYVVNAITWKETGFDFPFVANFTNLFKESADDTPESRFDAIVDSDTGWLFGLQPNRVWLERGDFKIRLVLNALAKLNRLSKAEDTEETTAILSTRWGGGLVFYLPAEYTNEPVQLTANITRLDISSKSEFRAVTGIAPESATVGELSLQVPFSEKQGLLIGVSVQKDRKPGWRLGYVLYES